ncbi:MAG: glycosyltransferase family 2 protein [Gemmatimonadota bacterium]
MEEPVTIVIPHYRAEVLVDCLASLFACPDWPIRVLVVDDGQNAPSLQRAAARFAPIEILRNPANLGFSASCNRGLEAADTTYAVLLNDDTRVSAGWLRPLVRACESDAAVAACQPKLLSATHAGCFDYGGGAGGYIDRLGYTFCRGRLFDHLETDEGQYDRQVPLFWACGSAMFLRLAAVRQVGLLDLDFFMHFEEIDLCWRLQLAGYRIVAVPSSVVHHHSGFSLPPRSYLKAYLNHRNNLVTLVKNMPAARLARVLPLRLLLEAASVLAYAARGDWRLAPAPVAALVWCASHPGNLARRRRQSRSLVRLGADDQVRGVYPGSAAVQYYLRGRRRSLDLVPEDPPS